MDKLLIFDLDDTIFETRSIDFLQFKKAWEIIVNYVRPVHGEEISHQVVEELKDFPFDMVAEKFALPKKVILEFHDVFSQLNYTLNIEVFNDYHFIHDLPCTKILVTTGFESFQNAKVDALQIRKDFSRIVIDDPACKTRQFKKGIFMELLTSMKYPPDWVWVIGDNPNSELKAGKELGLNTIQRISNGKLKSEFSDYTIKSFQEIRNIVYRN